MTNDSKFDISKVVDDAISVITNPTDFYRNMQRSGGFAEPIIFLVVMAAIMGVILTVFSLFGGGRMGGMAIGFGAIIFVPIMALIMSFIAAAVMFVIWKLMGSSESYETAYRCVAYASA
ncbi:MAG: YIP1 family protein, partial [Gammaproteobacteria bacterium]|nr:YIP1 family protein [Gammaproteobacteria bacterium]